MMTFIVHGNFVINAKLLDYRRLGKQRIEAKQIINIICDSNKRAWGNHPIVLAWTDYVPALKYYANCVILEWIARGNRNTIELYDLSGYETIYIPWWSQWDRLHQSHKAMLLRKDPFYYKFVVDEEYKEYGYIWPNNLDYEDRDLPLEQIASEIPAELINPRFCKSPLKSNKNRICNRLIKNNNEFCKVHSK